MRTQPQHIELTHDEYKACKEISAQLIINNRVDGSNDYAPVAHKRDYYSFLGCIGEVGFARYIGVQPNWSRMKSSQGRGDIDVGELWEIRTTQQNSCGLNGSPLTIWKHNLAKLKTYYSPFVKVCVRFRNEERPPICEIFGWEMGYIIVSEEKFKPRRIGMGDPVLERRDEFLRAFVDPQKDIAEASQLKNFWLEIHHNCNEKIF